MFVCMYKNFDFLPVIFHIFYKYIRESETRIRQNSVCENR